MTLPQGPEESRLAERRVERRAAGAFVVAALAGVGLAIVYSLGGQPQLEGLLLGIAFAGLAYGLILWANSLLPQGPYVEERHTMPPEESERAAFVRDWERAPGRPLLRRTLLGAGLVMGAVALFPIRSLGPRPGKALGTTEWEPGRRIVTPDGTPIRADDVPVGGILTGFPEGYTSSADSQVIVIGIEPGLFTPLPGRELWSPEGLVVYSKVCTHAACPVGLYEVNTHQLLCPCHQSAFDVLAHAEPVFGPAVARLPQLPITIGDDGVLEATGDFPEPVGPGYWRRG